MPGINDVISGLSCVDVEGYLAGKCRMSDSINCCTSGRSPVTPYIVTSSSIMHPKEESMQEGWKEKNDEDEEEERGRKER